MKGLHNWRVFVKATTMFVSTAEPADAGDVKTSGNASGRGSESGKGRSQIKNSYVVNERVVTDMRENNGDFEFYIGDQWYSAPWKTRYVNKNWPHHTAHEEVHAVFALYKKLNK